jgi:glycosyltransferase involved in cell wall biosynthesis
VSAGQPLVTAVVTSYNHERYLRGALESALAQDVPDLEVIAIDDASSDGSPRILDDFARDPRLRIERHRENQGVSRVFNRGLALARGTWVAYLGSDDFWLPGHLSGALAALTGSDLALCYGRVRVVDAEGRDVEGEDLFGSAPDPEFLSALLRRSNFVPFISVVVRRDVALEVGGFDENLVALQDYDLWLRIAARHPTRFLDRTSGAFRWDGGNTSGRSALNSVRLRRDLARILEHWLAERADDVRRVGAESAVRSRLASTYLRLGRREPDPAAAARLYRRSLELDPRRLSALGRYFVSSLRAALSGTA